MKHRYPTIITQHSQEINQVEGAATATNRHQQMTNKINDDDTGKELNYRQLSKHPNYHQISNISLAKELGRLSQG